MSRLANLLAALGACTAPAAEMGRTAGPEPVRTDPAEPIRFVDTAQPIGRPALDVSQRGAWLRVAMTLPEPGLLQLGAREAWVPEGSWQAHLALDWTDVCNVADSVWVRFGDTELELDTHGVIEPASLLGEGWADPSAHAERDPVVRCAPLHGAHWLYAEPGDRVVSLSWPEDAGVSVAWSDGTPWHEGPGHAWAVLPSDTARRLWVDNPDHRVIARAVWQGSAPARVR